jgi:hypothetical protein
MAKAFLVAQRLRAHRADGAPVTKQTGAWEALWLRYPAQGSAWRLNGGVDVRLLRLTDPCAGAPVRGRGGLAAGPGDLRRHRAAQLVNDRVHCHPLRRHCQVVEVETRIRQAGASPQSYSPFRQPAPYR